MFSSTAPHQSKAYASNAFLEAKCCLLGFVHFCLYILSNSLSGLSAYGLFCKFWSASSKWDLQMYLHYAWLTFQVANVIISYKLNLITILILFLHSVVLLNQLYQIF